MELSGLAGVDTMFDSGGSDRMFGGDGEDTMQGNGGNDTLHGSSDKDRLTGAPPRNDKLFCEQDDDWLNSLDLRVQNDNLWWYRQRYLH